MHVHASMIQTHTNIHRSMVTVILLRFTYVHTRIPIVVIGKYVHEWAPSPNKTTSAHVQEYPFSGAADLFSLL